MRKGRTESRADLKRLSFVAYSSRAGLNVATRRWKEVEGYERRRGNVTYFSLAQLMIPLLLLLLLHFLSVSPQDETYRDVYRELMAQEPRRP